VANEGTEGKYVKIGEIDTYSVGSGTNAIVLLTDVFGYKFSNIQKIADTYAAAGFRVVVPDLFAGDAVPADTVIRTRESFLPWLQRNPPEKALGVAKTTIQAVRDDYKATSIQAQGYCYGGKLVVHLLATDLIKAGVVAHPGMVTVEDANAIIHPALFVCAERDNSFGSEIKAKFEQALKTNKIEATFIDYPGTEHGFAVRGPAEVEKQKQKSLEDSLAFLKAHV